MSRMICVDQSRGRSDPNLVVHPTPDVPQVLKVVEIGYINWIYPSSVDVLIAGVMVPLSKNYLCYKETDVVHISCFVLFCTVICLLII